MHRSRPLGILTLLVSLAFVPPRASLADGDLDPAFDGDGKTTIGFDLGWSNYDGGLDVAAFAGGGLAVVGSAQIVTGDADFAFAVLGANGAPRNGFSFDGKRTLAFNLGPSSQRFDVADSVVVQPDGKILACGPAQYGSYNRLVLARLLPNGEVDPDFGAGGEVVLAPFGHNDSDNRDCRSVVLRKNGKIVVPFYNGFHHQSGLIQLESDGDLDPTFAGDGISELVDCPDNANLCYLTEVVELPDGKLMAVGTKNVQTDYDLFFARYTDTGQLDDTFSGDGQVTVNYPAANDTNDAAADVALDASGRLVVLTDANDGGDHTYVLTRIISDGVVDTSFGLNGWKDGRVRDPPAATQEANGLLVQGDGKVIVTGYYEAAASDENFAVVRFTANAQGLDVGFGLGGRSSVAFDQGASEKSDRCFGSGLIAGRPVLVGAAKSPTGYYDIGVARLTSTYVFQDGFESGSAYFWPSTAP